MFKRDISEAWPAGLKCLQIANNQCTIVINFQQDFVASMHSNFFQVRTDRGILGKLGCPNSKNNNKVFSLMFVER